ncbi:MAG: protein tyrosine phosphatase [Deltaproteobacteria bacterium GWB2_55_19]|nr:MAG: protein tyrosine phosphatase [Deltaproteobacteria bacterium GWB2_55_19]
MLRKYKFFILPFVVFFIPLSYFSYLYGVSSNFHTVTAGEAYRSAQPDRDDIEYYIREYGIRSILNLRGENSDKQWYIDEIKVSAEHNVKHYDLALSAEREPTDEEAQRLMDIFRNAPRPILMHCMSGADRTGLVSAMWKEAVDNKTKTEAEKELSIWFGHIPIGKTAAMDRFFDKWSIEAHELNSKVL